MRRWFAGVFLVIVASLVGLAGCKEISNPSAILNPSGATLTGERSGSSVTVVFTAGSSAVDSLELTITADAIAFDAANCRRLDTTNINCSWPHLEAKSQASVTVTGTNLACSADWYEGGVYRGPLACSRK